MKDKFDEPPDDPAYYEIRSIDNNSTEYQRDALLHFITDKGLTPDLVKYLDEHFPEVDGRRDRKDADT